MKRSGYIRNERGIALVASMIIMLLLLVLGAAAMQMSQHGFNAIPAEKRYQLANWKAESAVQEAVGIVVNNALCPTGFNNGTISGSSYFRIPDSGNTYCFIHGTGVQGSAKVVKTLVVLRAGTEWGGMVTRGGNINLAGSSAIAGCDLDEQNYANKCGMLPAVIFQAGQLQYQQADVSSPISQCQNEGTLKGFEGNPPLMPTQLPNDLVPLYFGVTDTNGNGSAWDDLLIAVENKYSNTISGQTFNVEFYPNLPSTPTVSQTATPTCNYTGSNTCTTTSPTNIRCGTGVSLPACSNNTNPNCNLDITPCNSIYIGTALTISQNINNFGKQILTANPVTISATVSNLNLTTNNTVTISANLSSSKIAANKVMISTAVSNSYIEAGSSANDSVTINGTLTNTNIMSAGRANINRAMTNSNIFADILNFDVNGTTNGGFFYAKTRTIIDANGSPTLGTVANPIVLLAGSGNISMPGNLTINGLIFADSTNISITGAVELQGTLINTKTATISNTGNGTIQFNKQVLDNLFSNNGGLTKQPRCGGGNKSDYIANTKTTVY